MIDVTLIGTGALQPLPHRALASAALTLSGRTLLLDCGEGTQSAARAAGVSLLKIDAIALTHYHGDHLFGLPGLWQSMGVAGRTQPLSIIGPAGLFEAMKPLHMLCPALPFDLCLTELPPEGVSLHALSPVWPQQAVLTPFATAHRVPSQGYRLELRRAGKFSPERARSLGVPVACWKSLQQGQSVQVNDAVITPEQVLGAPRRPICIAYTGDTAMCDGIVSGARNADLLIAEGTYGENDQAELAIQYGHMTFAHAAQMAAQAGARSLWLTHYSPMIDDPNDHIDSAVSLFPGAKAGQDGMRVTLRFDEEDT